MMRLLYVVFWVGLSLGGCSRESQTAVELSNKRQILLVGNQGEPADIDPHITTGIPETHIQLALFEGLVSKSSETLQIVPGVAESWTVSEDGLHYTFHIRKNALWSNGQPLTAHDFVWSWRRALLPTLGNLYAYAFYNIKNAEAFNKGQIADFTEVGVKARSDYLLDVELLDPAPYFLELLTHHAMFPVNAKAIEQFGAPGDRGTNWSKPENFVGNGPFVLSEWVPNKIVSVTRNTYYWDKQRIKLHAINFYPIDKSTTEERMFRAGQLHIIRQLPTDKIALYQRNHSDIYRHYKNFTTYFYRFNTTKPPLDDVRVRRALAYAINRDDITKRVTRGGQLAAYSFVPPMETGYQSVAKMPEDNDKARELLAEAGYPNGKDFPALKILYNTDEDHQKIALVVQQMWKNVLNIDVTLENQDWKVFLAGQRSMRYDIVRSSWSGDYYDPYNFLEIFRADSGNNRTGWSNSTYEQLLDLASATNVQEQRYKYFQKAEKVLIDEAPILPIYTYTSNMLVASSVKNWHSNIMDYWSYKDVYLQSE